MERARERKGDEGQNNVSRVPLVLECVRASDGQRVALKALNAPPSLRAEGLLEAELLTLAARASPHVVPLLDLLDDGPHVCLVMELLGPTLRQLMEERQLCPLPLAHVASVLAQMFNALEALQIHHIVHTDVKTDNIMVVDSQEEMLFVKLIDFSCAFYNDVPQPDFYVQTRYYRAPEVMLNVDLGQPVDVWSLGCVAAELAMGRALFEGANEAEMIFCICSMLGAPPQAIMLRSSRSTLYFWTETRGTLRVWHLLDADALGIGKDTASRRIRYLSEVMEVHFAQRKRFGREFPNKDDSLDFLDILTKMLTLCPEHRILPREALNHPFVSYK